MNITQQFWIMHQQPNPVQISQHVSVSPILAVCVIIVHIVQLVQLAGGPMHTHQQLPNTLPETGKLVGVVVQEMIEAGTRLNCRQFGVEWGGSWRQWHMPKCYPPFSTMTCSVRLLELKSGKWIPGGPLETRQPMGR